MKVSYQLKAKLVAKFMKEKEISYQYKRPRITEWKLNEDELNGKKRITNESRFNQSFGLAHKLVHTFLSKIDEPLNFEYERGELGDTRKVALFNALKDKYRKVGRWDYIDRLGKYNALVYGLALYMAYGEQDEKGNFVFKNRLIDPEDFHIDTNVRVDEIEEAQYIGWFGTKYSKKALTDLMKDKNYDKGVIKDILSGPGGDNNRPQSEIDKRNRQYSLNIWKDKEDQVDIYDFYTWITTAEDGERYYMVINDQGICIRCQKWTEIQKSGLYPIWYWHTYPEPFEFWSRGPLEIGRLTIQAQERSINQSMDNAEMIIRPQKIVNIDRLVNIAEVKWKKDGVVQVTGDGSLNDAYKVTETPVIQTPIELYGLLDGINQAVSGVTADVQGVSDADKVGVYEGNLQQASDRFALMQDSYEQGYYRLAQLFREAVKQHFTKKMAIKVLGSKGVTFVEIKPQDLRLNDNDFDIVISSTSVEETANMQKARLKVQYIDKWVQVPKMDSTQTLLNQKVAFETGATALGFSEDEINNLLDTETFTDSEQAAMVEENLQRILNGEKPELYYEATEEYLTKMGKSLRAIEKQLEKDPSKALLIDDHLMQMQEIIGENIDNEMNDPRVIKQVEQEALQEQQVAMGNGQTVQPTQSEVPVQETTFAEEDLTALG